METAGAATDIGRMNGYEKTSIAETEEKRENMKIVFEPVTAENMEDVLKLHIAGSQKGFVETVKQCLDEAREWACWRPVGIYIDGQLVGFAMYCLWEEKSMEDRVWMDRFLIDERYQGKGYGKACLPVLLDKIQGEYGCDKIYLSVVEENQTAIHLYREFGFEFNGESDLHGEKVMVRQN